MSLDRKDRNINNEKNEIKTYAIPMSIYETNQFLNDPSQANLTQSVNTININNDKSSSDRNLIDKALKFHVSGDFVQAKKIYKLLYESGYSDPRLFSNYGMICKQDGEINYAISLFKKSIELYPNIPETYNNLGNAFLYLGIIPDAIKNYEKALKIKPDFDIAQSGLISCQSIICDWSRTEITHKWLKLTCIRGQAIEPFTPISYEDNPKNHLERAINSYKKIFYKKTTKLIPPKNKKIRVGYFSSDFYNHATMYLMIGIFELYDKSKFEIFVYDYSFTTKDDMSKRLIKIVDFYRDISKINDLDIVKLAKSDRLNIAIDLKGYTKNSRLSIFSYRLAPIQISYLGFPGSTGFNTIDYLIADKVVIPNESKKFYSEKIIYMPDCYQCNDNKKEINNDIQYRSKFGLPNDAFVFSCFNDNYKIRPKEFDIWMRLLLKVEGSVIWLYKSNEWAKANLIKEANRRSVSPDRIIFAEHLPLPNHLARLTLSDLALDTFNCNGHTTTSDALWAGLPVLTKIGSSFAARVSASLLENIGLHELITQNEGEYEETALRLAFDRDELLNIKLKLKESRKTSNLFNTDKYVKDLEEIFQNLVRKVN